MRSIQTLSLALATLATPALAETRIIELAPSAELLVLDVRTAEAHNCPGTIDLELAWTADDSYTIQYDTRVADYVSLIKNNVSAAARTEIQQFELAIASGPVCLSYGYSQGKVYLDVRNNDAGAVQITTPDSLVIESVSALHK